MLNVYEMRTGSALLSTKLSCSANQIQFSPFGDVIVVASSDNKVKLIDVSSGKLLSEVWHSIVWCGVTGNNLNGD